MARRLRDPLTELSQLCNADEDLTCIHFHPMQVITDVKVCIYSNAVVTGAG